MEDGRQSDYRLQDGEREVRFTGVLLGEATSKQAGKLRWSEISIYKTKGGNYIVAGCGRSLVPGEVDRHWAQTCEEPQGVIERLHMLDHDRSRYLPRTSILALNQARERDAELDRAFLVQLVD